MAAPILAALGFFAGLLCCKVLNIIPAEWLCDYDEEPSEDLKSGKRYDVKKHGIVLGVVIAVFLGSMTLINGVSHQLLISVFMCIALALVATSDAKYTIIPDQFTIAAAFIAADFAVVDYLTTQSVLTHWYDPLIGAAVGGGILIVLDIFSILVLKKEGFGFGDIKLLAALGLMFGWKYILVLMVVASLIAAVHFLILIFASNGKLEEERYLPMAPYLCMGAAATMACLPLFNMLFVMYKAVMEMKTLP